MWAVIGGLCLDLLSSGPYGLTVFPLAVAALVASLAYGRRLGGYIILPVLLAFPLSLVFYLLETPLLHFFGQPMDWQTALLRVVLPASLLNVVAIAVLFPLLRLIDRATGREQISW